MYGFVEEDVHFLVIFFLNSYLYLFHILYFVVSNFLIRHIFQTLFTKMILIAFIVEDSLFVRWYSFVTRDFHLFLLYLGELHINCCLFVR